MDEIKDLFGVFFKFQTVFQEQNLNKLFNQLQLSSRLSNLIFCDKILLDYYFKQLLQIKEETNESRTELLQEIQNRILNFIVETYKNCDNNHAWIIYQIVHNFQQHILQDEHNVEHGTLEKFKQITDVNYTQFNMIFADQHMHSLLPCEDVIYFYKNLEIFINHIEELENDRFQSILIKLRNALFQNPIFTSFIIDTFSQKYCKIVLNRDSSQLNCFDRIYLHALIHTLKNQSKLTMVNILLRCPDSIFSDENLCLQLIDYFLLANNKKIIVEKQDLRLLSLYASTLYRSTPELIKSVSKIRHQNLKYRSCFFKPNCENYFDLKECFLLSVQRGEHFITEFKRLYINNHDLDISPLPLKSQIITVLFALYDLINANKNDGNLFSDKISRYESTINNILLQYELQDLDQPDYIFSLIVEKLKFIFKFSEWCTTNLNHNNSDRSNFYYGIIVSLLSGSSPLKILTNHGFLEFKRKTLTASAFNEEQIVYNHVYDLIRQFDQNESMILKGFLLLRLIFVCFFTKENDRIGFDVGYVKDLLQNIFPIEFRIEIMENLFSLLFLTKNDVNHDINLEPFEDEDYLDETVSKPNLAPISPNKVSRKRNESDSNSASSCFICPNWLIPKLLEILKDCLYKTGADIYTFTHNDEKIESNQTISNDNYIYDFNNLDESKNRISTLLKFVSEAQFRYDVIRPAFFRNLSTVDDELQANDVMEYSDVSNPIDLSKGPSTSSSDTEQKSRPEPFGTSLISCMLASNTQLLCYTLIENRLDNSKQIARLFSDDLKNSKELQELELLELFSELHSKISNVYSQFSNVSTFDRMISDDHSSTSKLQIGEIANLGIRSSKIQALIYEMLLKMDNIDNLTKKIFIIDYSLVSSPSLEISKAILESIFTNNSDLFHQYNLTEKILPEKVEYFILNIQKMINELGRSINISELSMTDFLEKSLTNSNSLLDARSFVNSLQFEVKLKNAYYEFYSHFDYLENQIIQEPSSMNSQISSKNIRQNSALSAALFESIIGCCSVGKLNYLKTLLLYVRKVSKALAECKRRNLKENNERMVDSSAIYLPSYFSILKQSPSAILCSMVIKSKISPKIIDDLALMMKVNLIGVLCSVYCPTIPTCFILNCDLDFFITELCHPSLSELVESYFKGAEHCQKELNSSAFMSNYFSEETDLDVTCSSMEQSFQPLINNEVLNYFNSKCSILVQMLKIVNLINDLQISNISSLSGNNLQIYKESPLLRWVELIKHNFVCGDLTLSTSLAFHPRIVSGHSAVIKTLEFYASNHNYLQIYNLFKYIDDVSPLNRQRHTSSSTETTRANSSFKIFQNAIYSRLTFMKENAKYAFQIVQDSKMKCDLILRLLTTSDNYDETFIATRLIRLCLQTISDDEVLFESDTSECKLKLESFLCEIEFYAAVGQLTGLKTWKLAKDNLESIDILTIIKTKKRYLLAIDWYKIRGIENETCDIHLELLIYAYSELNDYASLRKLFYLFIDQMKSNNVIHIVEKTLSQVDNLELRSFLVDFLVHYNRKRMDLVQADNYEQYKLGIEIVNLLSMKIRDDYIKLISKPYLLIEQLLMNCEIESLEKIINQYKLINADELVEKYSQKSVYIEIYESNSFNGSDLTLISSSVTEVSFSVQSNSFFTVPEKIPSKDQWVSDRSETHCMQCQIVCFSMINRRHHCRRCGRVVCSSCSANSFLIPEINSSIAVRVCNDCFHHLQHNKRKQSTQSTTSVNSNGASQTFYKRTNWQLSASDDNANELRRSDFVYESSPSVTLCLAILRLHSDKRKSCKFIIEKICAPLLESTASNNVDSTLLIEIIRSLLISTRISIEEDLNSDDYRKHKTLNEIELLNLYLDRLDVIRMLINSNYGTKETIGYVLNNNTQKLQEKLLEMERFELAIDIAKKYGFDSSSIWKTWAIICLKHFQFVEARRKFSRYFDQVTRTSEVQLTLNSILDILVRNNCANLQHISAKDKCLQILNGNFDFFADSDQHCSLQQQHSFAPTSNKLSGSIGKQHLTPRIFQEIVYYLKQYGTYEDLLHFYVNYSYWKEAVDYFITTNRANLAAGHLSASFLQELFIPAQIKGSLTLLFAAIRHCDSQLNHLWQHLISICKYLDKNRFYNCLYRVQVLMNDYLRAAITQINCFFLNQTNESADELHNNIVNLDSFDLLYNRLNHLEKARDHCNMYLHNIEYAKVKPGCLAIDKKDVLKQIKLIEFQIEITKRFKQKRIIYPVTVTLRTIEPLDQLLASYDKSSSASSLLLLMTGHVLHCFQDELSIKMAKSFYPPTLLEQDISRKSLITSLTILYFCDSIEEGFRYSLRIIQDHELNSSFVYKFAGIFLLLNELEKKSRIVQILDQLNQLLVCIRSSYITEENNGAAEIVRDSPSPTEEPNSSSIASLMSSSMISEMGQSLSTPKHDKLCDDIVKGCIRTTEIIQSVLFKLTSQQQKLVESSTGISRSKLSELGESLIKLLSDDLCRIQAFLKAGKLKLAYLLAVSIGQRDNVVRVLDAARLANDLHYMKICEMWLRKNTKI